MLLLWKNEVIKLNKLREEMEHEIHTYLNGLNLYLHGCDALASEVAMWRQWYVKTFMKDKSDYHKNIFCSLPSQSVKGKLPDDV